MVFELIFQFLEPSQIVTSFAHACLTIVMGWVLARILPAVGSALLNFLYGFLVLLAVPVAFVIVILFYRLFILIP